MQQKCLDGKIYFIVKSIPSAEKYWSIGFQIQIVMKTLRKQTSPLIEERLMSLQEDSHVSLFPMQERGGADR